MKAAEWKWGAMSDKQKRVLCWWRPSSRYADYNGIIADGSIRSGKTVAMGFSFVIWAMETFNGQNFAMCGKTIESFRRNVVVNLKRQLHSRGFNVQDKKTENLIIISKGSRINYFYLFGGKDERSQDLIQGITLAGAFFDEVALMPESFVNQATGRCSVEGSKWWFNCNPNSPYHWFYVNWIKKAKERKLLYLHFTMFDNLTLSESIRRRYEDQYSGVFHSRYILGLWVVAEGIIYRVFSKDKHVLHKLPDIEQSITVSSDFGIQNATTFLLFAKKKDEAAQICVNEYYFSGREESRQVSVSELVEGLKATIAETEKIYGKPLNVREVIVDPSAASLIVELRKNGFHVLKGKNDVTNGIADVTTMLKQDKLYLMDWCKHTIKEFGVYRWDEKAQERGEDKPIKDNDHCMDALRYFIYTKQLARSKGTARSTFASEYL